MPTFTNPRLPKTAHSRLDEVLLYLSQNLSAIDHAEVNNLVQLMTPAQQRVLGTKLSFDPAEAFGQRAANTIFGNKKKRCAKRALLLVTDLFLNNEIDKQRELERIKLLPEHAEATFLDEIKSWFTIPSATPETVADLAVAHIEQMPNWNNVNMNPSLIVRGKYLKAEKFNCYNAVVYWAFQGGAISRRFLWNKLHGKDGAQFFPIFSACGWTTDIEYNLADGQPPMALRHDFVNSDNWIIPKGMAVYYVTRVKPFGHVALSLGNGEVISQNSVIPAYPNAVLEKYKTAVWRMNRAITHIISIKNFWDIHYNPGNVYSKLQHTTTAFWERYLPNER